MKRKQQRQRPKMMTLKNLTGKNTLATHNTAHVVMHNVNINHFYIINIFQ